MWKKLEMGFDYVDENNDGAIDMKEVEAVMKKHGPPEDAFLRLFMKNKAKGADWPELTPEQEKEITDWVKDQLADGGTITKDEAKKAVAGFADKHDFTITKEMWEQLNAIFDWIDDNGDGEITGKEMKMAIEAHGGEKNFLRLKAKKLVQVKNTLRSYARK